MWDYDVSRDRVKKHLDGMGTIEIKRLVRGMDLDNLSETRCRQIAGSHTYAEVRSLGTLVTEDSTDDERRRIIQATHVFEREVDRIATAVGAHRIHFQGGRVHLLTYEPFNNPSEIVARAIIGQLILDRFDNVFSEEFDDLPDLHVRSASDYGDTIATRNGTDGDRELLFIGDAANQPAKMLSSGSPRRVTENVHVEAPDDVVDLIEEETDGNGFRLLRPSDARFAEILEDHGIVWSAEKARERVRADKTQFPADKAGLYRTTSKIDFDDLSFSNSKLVDAATVYGDVSGFTAHVEAAVTEDERRERLREFHAIRKEMARVVKIDYDAVRVQFQGDRVQAIVSVPADDAEKISDTAVRLGLALQASFERVLKDLLPGISNLGLAVGISRGTTIAAKLGARGHRDRICLGSEVLRAEQNEERVGKKQTGISGNVRDHLADDVAKRFAWSSTAGCYVATGLDIVTLDRATKAAAAYAAGAGIGITNTPRGPIVSPDPNAGRTVQPSRSWSTDR